MANSTEERIAEILRLRQGYGDQVLLLAHHYQRPEVVAVADHIGDSYQLAKVAAESSAPKVLFCGVSFMGESAAILAKEGTSVYLPEPTAGCPMADMADPADVASMLRRLAQLMPHRRVLPVTYVNSTAAVKAVTGEAGGIVCTSANAKAALSWALGQSDAVLFLPDQMLARNSARELGVAPVVSLDPFGPMPPQEALEQARVLVWNGYCHVHTWFSTAHVAAARERFPRARILVHPESPEEVVLASDGSGSTNYLSQQVKEGNPGDIFVIGTEVNLVRRLASTYSDRTVVPLTSSLCPNMYKITLGSVQRLLEEWPESHKVVVPPEVASWARFALERMLALKV